MKIRKYAPLLIFLSSIVFFLPFLKNNQFNYISSQGDYVAVIDPFKTLLRNVYVFRSDLYNGTGDNTANLLGLYSPYLVLMYLLSLIKLSQLFQTISIIAILYLVSCLSMFLYLKSKKEINKLSILEIFTLCLYSILYSFSPYFVNLFSPGHFLFIILSAVFPLVQLMIESTISKIHNKENILIDFSKITLLLFLLGTPFGNLGVMGIFYALIVGEYLLAWVSNQIKFFEAIKLIIYFSVSIVLANLWWLAPMLLTIGNITSLVNQSRLTIGGSIDYATRNSTMLNIISGFPEGIVFIKFSVIIQFFFVLLICLAIISIIKHKKNNFVIINALALLLILVFVTKGPNNPFGSIFDFLYSKFGILQILRRPASKLYWIFIFFLVSIISSASQIKNKIFVKVNILFLLTLDIILVLYTTNFLKLFPFNIPTSYFESKDYLLSQNAQKILLLPDLGGQSPNYGSQLNYHIGVDFLSQIWIQKKYIPSNSNWSIADDETNTVNNLYNNILLKQNICEQAKDLNISHIIIRNDLMLSSSNEILLNQIETTLNDAKYIKTKKQFSDDFIIYSLKDNCVGGIITANSKITSVVNVNPTKYKVELLTENDSINLEFREKFVNTWTISSGNWINNIYRLITKKQLYKEHSEVLGYANGFLINVGQYCSDNPNECSKEKNNETRITLFIEYWPQSIFYMCLIFSGITVSACIVIIFITNKKRIK